MVLAWIKLDVLLDGDIGSVKLFDGASGWINLINHYNDYITASFSVGLLRRSAESTNECVVTSCIDVGMNVVA